MARPRKPVELAEIVRLRREGLSWNVIARRMTLGRGTVVRAYQAALAMLQPSQNPEVTILKAHGNCDSPEVLMMRRLYRARASRTLAPAPGARNVSSVRLTGLEGASFRN